VNATPSQLVPPQRLLVVSATIGEGHHATARAVEERARRLWPGCTIRRVDTLAEMGRCVGPGFRWVYRVNVDVTPWLYDFFYRSLWRHRWFAASSCRVVGVWSGLRLAPIIEEYRPDLVVSTYPLGTAGLDWIRRRGGLDVPVAAIISDFAPHPFWVYPEVDLHYVASEPSLRAMYRARPDARGAVGAPPVVSAFRPAIKAEARRRCGLPEHRLVVLVSCGSLGFGSVERAVEAGLAAGPDVCVVVACGRNEALRARLVARAKLAARDSRRSSPAQRLVPLGWTSEMPTLTAAADVVVTNAGGATALEAVACGRAVLMFEPIAGHGKANAELMVQAGLATRCDGPAELVAALRGLAAQPALLAHAERRALTHIGALDLDAEIAALPGLPRHHGARPLSAPDAFFALAATPTVAQQIGAVLLLGGNRIAGSAGGDRIAGSAGGEQRPVRTPEQLASDLAMRITERVPTLPMLRRQLDLRPGRRPRWLPADDIDPGAHLRVRTVGAAHGVPASAALREFFGTPVPLDRPPWQLEVVQDADTARTMVLAKMHHSLGDGLAVTATLLGLLSDREEPRAWPDASHATVSSSSRFGFPHVRYRLPTRWRARAVHAGRVLRGLVSLATAGPAPPGGPIGPSSPARDYAMVELPAAAVRATAREHGVGTTALLLALVGEALHRIDPAGTAVDDRLRAMVPRTTHALRRANGGDHNGDHRGDNCYRGNHTAALALDLPVGPMPLSWRVVAVADALARLERADQPVAAQAVVAALGRLPAPLHATLVRALYRRRFFSLITSVLPGPRKAHYVWGVRVVSVFPVLPLAEGVGLAVGFLTWGDMIGVGVSTDTALLPGAGRFADTLRRAFDDLATDVWGAQKK
jgi:diacylglycerol O-acyltransferase / wax synthase